MAKYPYTPEIRSDNEAKWASLSIDKNLAGVAAVAKKLIALKPRYQVVERKTGVPWHFIAITHQREANADFRCVLHNGERIVGTGHKTRLVPEGRGPFDTWEAAAIDALTMGAHKLDTLRDWSAGRYIYEVEKFNGFGYRGMARPSPYLWSHTNHYKDSAQDSGDPVGGKYYADHKWSSDIYDAQIGTMAMLKVMMDLDTSIKFGSQKVSHHTETTATTGAVIAGAGTAYHWWDWIAAHPYQTLLYVGLAVLAVSAILRLTRRRR